MTEYVRFQSAVPNARGSFPGVFALANGLAAHGLLSREDVLWHRAANDRANDMYAEPTRLSPNCYDPDINRGARAWFKISAEPVLKMTAGYLELLDRYEIPWVELRTHNPGRIVHDDDVQVVTVPFSYERDWPLASSRLTSIPSNVGE